MRMKHISNLGSRFFREHKTHIAALIAVSVFLGWMLGAVLQSPLSAPKEITIKEGQGAYAIADILKKEGVIENKFVFVAYVFNPVFAIDFMTYEDEDKKEKINLLKEKTQLRRIINSINPTVK